MKSGPVSISCGHRELQSFRRLAPGNYNMCIRGLQHKRIRKFSKDDRRSRHERQSRHIEHGDDEVGKLRPVERRKYAQNSQEKHCPQKLAGEKAANRKRCRRQRHDDTHTHPEIGWRAKENGYRQGQRRDRRYDPCQDARFRLRSLPVLKWNIRYRGKHSREHAPLDLSIAKARNALCGGSSRLSLFSIRCSR